MISATKETEIASASFGPRVLCVDDAEVGLALRTNILQNRGYEVTALTDPRKAAESFQPDSQELAVLDYQMPEMTGAELAWHLRHKSPKLKIILFTGATYVPQSDLRYFDSVIHKLDGVDALLGAMESLLVPTNRPCAGGLPAQSAG